MSLSSYARLCSVLTASALTAGIVSAAPPPGGAARPGGAHPGGAPRGGAPHPGGAPHVAPPVAYRPYYAPVPYNYGYRNVGIGIGVGLGYGNLGYGYGGYGYGGGYGYSGGYAPLGYGYSSLGVPAIPGIYSSPTSPYLVVPAQPQDAPEPLPLPAPGASGESAPATIIVIASDGSKVTFDGIDTEQTGTRHSFTTRPIKPGVEARVSVKVDGPGGPATLSIGVRTGEKATVDMRK